MLRFTSALVFLLLASNLNAEILYHDTFDQDGLTTNKGVGGGAVSRSIQSHSWADDGNAVYRSTGVGDSDRAILFSKDSFQSDTGFKLTVRYFTDSLRGAGGHDLSIGLIRSDSGLASYDGLNPFRANSSVYGIGLNVIADGGTAGQGIHFSNGSSNEQLDQSGTRAQFVGGAATTVTLEIEKGGYWCYRIDGVYEDSGVLVEGIDLSQSYHVVVYGQGGGGNRKILQFIKLETAYAQGERAASSRGTWSGGMGLDKIQDLKTLDTVQVRLTDGAVLSASHWAPHRILEYLWGGDLDEKGKPINLCVPRWGDLTKPEPENDPIREKMLAIKAAGFKVKAYANCENFNGSNSKEWEVIAQRWKDFCDTNPKVVAFVNSQPFHTGVWDRKKQQYVDASEKFPNRKYMFCYTEIVLKDYALRYGDLIDAWIFDSATDINQAGDNPGSGVVEEQRIYQAFAKAVHAGNPEIAIAFNNGRSTVKSKSYPFATPTHYDDFTFGHGFGGNNSHGDKKGGQFGRNYKHVQKMTETNGYVFAGGQWEWDDLIVGNLHSKLATTGWKSGGKLAWETEDFLQWNLEAMQAGGIMTWDGSANSKYNRNWTLRGWSYDLLKALDDYLAVHESPGTPNWARAYTVLPDAIAGRQYQHELLVGKDLWDPEGDPITAITTSADAPEWLMIRQDPANSERWVLGGVPTAQLEDTVQFDLIAKDSNGMVGTRTVKLHFGSHN
ncbi:MULTISPECIES: hypothetical protein [unclassified Lentimonas]|uniref:hypothetical protein n=1 Tax=unclassified Lentimonas TaxID=2630993 RepID=UPI00132C1ECE|nr:MULTISPECIES: hypothetical protein [unclassified Lentimonas]CAA6694954.1 Unannotated [Lentimonas sp. CC19]CAA6695279.1 Unannotated [Lentimonas sp. CC10]CAA7071986.1 Unannotated [Lentimonas sp. CC11]